MIEEPLDKLLRGTHGPPEFRDLGRSKLAKALGWKRGRLAGRWCSRCKGIWFGRPGECECPVCGNRYG